MTLKNPSLKNLFPETLRKKVIEIFGEHAIEPVLLELLPGSPDNEQSKDNTHLKQLLHPRENARLENHKFLKRQKEYLTGRISAKLATQRYLRETSSSPRSLDLADIEITSAKDGRPEVHLHGPQAASGNIDISISHSGNYVVSLASDSKCGIDLQQQVPTLLRVREKYCHEEEYCVLEKPTTAFELTTRLATLWTGKEAAKKALSFWKMPGFRDLQLVKATTWNEYGTVLSLGVTVSTSQKIPKQVTVVTDKFGDYLIGICLINEAIKNA